MSQKDYIVIAKILHWRKPPMPNEELQVIDILAYAIQIHNYLQWQRTVLQFVHDLPKYYPKFNEAKFLKACGMELPKGSA